MTIKATIDREAEMTYIDLGTRREGDRIHTLERDDFNFDINQDGELIGIEIYGILNIT